MKAITLTETQTREWAANEHLAQGPDDLPAKTIRRAKALLANHPEQDRVHVYAGEPLGNTVLLTVSRTGVSGSGTISEAIRREDAFRAVRYRTENGAGPFDLNELIRATGGIQGADRMALRVLSVGESHDCTAPAAQRITRVA